MMLSWHMCSGNVLAFLGSPPLFIDQLMVLPNLVLMLKSFTEFETLSPPFP